MPKEPSGSEKAVRRKLHQTIRKVGSDIAGFQFNTAVAALMELLNSIHEYAPVRNDALDPGLNPQIVSEIAESLALMMAPMTPHLGEEVWHQMGYTSTVYKAPWPETDERASAEDEITIAVQVNGKLRDTISVPAGSNDEILKSAAQGSPKVMEHTKGKQVAKLVVVPGKLVNIVVK